MSIPGFELAVDQPRRGAAALQVVAEELHELGAALPAMRWVAGPDDP
jgi:hypothetical protein